MAAENDELTQLWIYLSETVQQARLKWDLHDANDMLARHIKEQADEGLNAAMRLWLADNFAHEMRFEEARAAFEELAQSHDKLTFSGKEDGYPWAAYALERKADCETKTGDVDKALSTYDRILNSVPRGLRRDALHYRAGQLRELARRDDEAIKSYREAANADSGDQGGDWPIAEFAKRQAARLEKPPAYAASAQDLCVALARALQNGDAGKLRSMASLPHFCAGIPGSEFQFVDADRMLSQVAADLGVSPKVRVDPGAIEGAGSKLRLMTDGWQGALLQDKVWLIVTRQRDGWEWSGLAFSRPGKVWNEFLPGFEEQKNQPLEIGIKAPWRSGDCWTAGGLNRFLASFAWPIIFFEDNFGCCGYGPGGLYYNQPTTHVESHAFAIDFTRYVSGLPYLADAHNREILSVAEGVVTFVSPVRVPEHDHSGSGNRVEVEHPGLVDLFAALLRGRPLSPPFKYRSGYWHLGPFMPVSVGMFVRQGARLGLSDNSGNSFFSHLHFVIQDRDRGMMSVKPSPMDGKRLQDGDWGACVRSTNVVV